jgi:hypothetical protein
MTILTTVTQSGREQTHRSHELVDRNAFQRLDILESRLGQLARKRSLWWGLGKSDASMLKTSIRNHERRHGEQN